MLLCLEEAVTSITLARLFAERYDSGIVTAAKCITVQGGRKKLGMMA